MRGEREFAFRDTGRALHRANTDSLRREIPEYRCRTAMQHTVVRRDNKKFCRDAAKVHEK